MHLLETYIVRTNSIVLRCIFSVLIKTCMPNHLQLLNGHSSYFPASHLSQHFHCFFPTRCPVCKDGDLKYSMSVDLLASDVVSDV